MLIRLALIWITAFTSAAFAFQSNLSEAQCARFFKEYQSISKKMNTSSGDDLQSLGNRYGRLQERLEAFCQNTSYSTKKNAQQKQNTSHTEPEKIILFSDEAKQLAWEGFYTAPSYCLKKPLSSVNKLRCNNELERFQQLFEQQWQQNTKFTNKQSEEDIALAEQGIEKSKAQENSVEPTSDEQRLPAKLVQNTVEQSVKQAPPVIDYSQEQYQHTTGLDTLFVYIEDYLYLLILLLIVLLSLRFVVPVAKRLFTKHFSYIAVNKYLMKHLPVSDYTLYSKISLPIPGGMADIDELILSPYGIFVLTCQPQTGRIYADTTSEVWTEQLGKNRSNFNNPCRQLPLKIAGVKQLFGLEEHIQGLVVFDQEADFRTNMPCNVFQTGQLLAKIEHYEERVFTQEQISHFVLLLSEYKPSNPFKDMMSKLGQKKQPQSEWDT